MAGGRDDQLSPDGDRWRIELAEWCLSDAETSAVIKPGTQFFVASVPNISGESPGFGQRTA